MVRLSGVPRLLADLGLRIAVRGDGAGLRRSAGGFRGQGLRLPHGVASGGSPSRSPTTVASAQEVNLFQLHGTGPDRPAQPPGPEAALKTPDGHVRLRGFRAHRGRESRFGRSDHPPVPGADGRGWEERGSFGSPSSSSRASSRGLGRPVRRCAVRFQQEACWRGSSPRSRRAASYQGQRAIPSADRSTRSG
jgi:hypothetical protein